MFCRRKHLVDETGQRTMAGLDEPSDTGSPKAHNWWLRNHILLGWSWISAKAADGRVRIWHLALIYGPNLPCVNSPGCCCCCWCNGVGIVADNVQPFIATVFHLLLAHSTKQRSSQTGFVNMIVSSVNFSDLHSPMWINFYIIWMW